jgi:hypothetical protein
MTDSQLSFDFFQKNVSNGHLLIILSTDRSSTKDASKDMQ